MSKELATTPSETGLEIRPEGELAVAQTATFALAEIQGAMMLAKRFPRDFNAAWQNLMKTCQRKTFAEVATYAFPRGGVTVSGPSINLAKAAAQAYGNVRWGLNILRNDDSEMTIEGWAWDVEQNIKVTAQDSFQKLIYRKSGGWVKPDERDLRELVNRRGAILIRNCLFGILPRDLAEDAMAQARKTLKQEIKDPNGEKKRLILEMDKYGITVEMVNEYFKSQTWTTDDLVELNGILLAIKDGTAKRDDYFGLKEEVAQGGLNMNDLSAGDPSKHQGHEPQSEKKEPPAKKGGLF